MLAEFPSIAVPAQRRRFEDTVTGPEGDATGQIKATVTAPRACASPERTLTSGRGRSMAEASGPRLYNGQSDR